MQSTIHPTTHTIKATCACGATFEVESTLDHDIQLDVCSQCHPFYTGKQNLVDTAGRVDRFRERQAKASKMQEQKAAKKAKPAEAPAEESTPESPAASE